jgi:hypothetical protein
MWHLWSQPAVKTGNVRSAQTPMASTRDATCVARRLQWRLLAMNLPGAPLIRVQSLAYAMSYRLSVRSQQFADITFCVDTDPLGRSDVSLNVVSLAKQTKLRSELGATLT